MKLTDLLTGQKVLEETQSKYNGEIKVINDLTWGKIIKAGELTQSGGIVAKIWQQALKKVLKEKPIVKKCLILGLGGGSAAKLTRQYWVTSQIVGVDIDERIVNLGKKYLGLGKVDMHIEIMDAEAFVIKNLKLKITNYDLIIVDLYNGDKFPEKFEKEEFAKNIKKLLNKKGIAVFNRLYGTDHRPDSMRFGRRLEKIFKKVDYIFPQANLVFVCYN